MIRQIVSLIVVFGLLLLGTVPSPAIAHEVGGHYPSSHSSETPGKISHNSTSFAKAMELGMEKMMADMHQLGLTGNPDVDFLAMMIPHHEGAVEMARLVLIYGQDPLVRQLAGEIIAAQQVEVAAMQARLSTLQQGTNLKPGSFPAISGTRGA